MTPLPCIACGKELESVFDVDKEDLNRNQPYAGTTFTSHGHYGSTVFDPFDLTGSRYLELNVCDECLVEAWKVGKVLLGREYTRYDHTLGPWDPEKEL